MRCKHCEHDEPAHYTLGNKPCLYPGRCNCPGFEPAVVVKPKMYSVRIDREDEKYIFQVEPMDWCAELVAMDSAPGIIAFVEAPDPGAAAARAWEKALKDLAHLDRQEAQPAKKLLELLGDKT